jgi:voltage-gated potassium channel Kch
VRWRDKLFTGGEILDEDRPRYLTRNYYIVCGYIAVHSLLVFLALLSKNLYSFVFLGLFILIMLQLGGTVWK